MKPVNAKIPAKKGLKSLQWLLVRGIVFLGTVLLAPVECLSIGVGSKFPRYFSQEVALVGTPKAPDTAYGEMTHIGKSVVIKGELSCSEELYTDGQVEGAIDQKGNRLTIGKHGRVKASVKACVVVVQGKLEGDISASDRVALKQSAIVTGNIATQRISIDEGAYFKGNVNIQKEARKIEVPGEPALSSK